MKLKVLMINDFAKQMALQHLNYDRDVKYRCVEVELTDEQVDKLTPLVTGSDIRNGKKETYYECIDHAWVEE
jgi:hypothetical protein